jgi:hypothetical protein
MNKFTGHFIVICFLFISIIVQSQESFSPEKYFDRQIPSDKKKELQFLAFFINQGVASNFYPENVFMKGQVIGRMFGDNTTHTSDTSTCYYFEQRILPFFIYQPKLFNGKAILRASFEIDWTWGDASYGAGGNLGSALSGDYVNLQTQNIELELIPAKGWAVNLGMQRIFDTPYNPYRTLFDKMTNTGYRLGYWGTDGVGISVRRDKDYSHWKAGFYELYENNVQEDDDVLLSEYTYEGWLSKNWRLGGSLYYLRDRSNGEGGVSIYAQGLNSKLNGYNGTFNFNFGNVPYKADILWIGSYFSRNADFMLDRYQLTGFFNYNLGTARTDKNLTDNYEKAVDIGGFAANLQLGYRYGQTTNDKLSFDFVYSTGDKNKLNDKKYSGVITGNTWGAPAAIFIGTGAYLLFPHANVVNRYTPAISDLSNMGYGLTAGVFNVSKDIIPNQLNGKAGLAFAMSNVAPQGGGNFMGTEINGCLKYNMGPLMSLEFHAAYLMLGDFYDSNDESYSFDVNSTYFDKKPINPWTAFVVFKWLMF